MAETSTTPPLPNELPVVPLRGAVVLPMTVAPLGVSRAVSVEAVNKALAGDRMVLEPPLRERPPIVRADVINTEELPIDLEQNENPILDLQQHLAGIV